MHGQQTVTADAESEPFENYFRGLLLGAAARSVRSEEELQQALGHRRRARRAGRVRLELDALQGLPPRPGAEERAGPRRLGTVGIATAWLAAGAFLLAALAGFGVHSWWTGIADVALLVLSCAWFLSDARSLGQPTARSAGAPATEGAAPARRAQPTH